ncbi:hypothetical protein [Spirillospora sp. NBC_01491]|uniref:hypothetical protein n=1 Tax=Spirillospora sp. NBC_01491 TaxID=2976007 RepID=UPI002E33BD8F|nr:hypothetical protein [Spirillospora sp. NBC_01491]
MAPRCKEPNRRLAELMAEVGLSQKGLASRVVRLGERRGSAALRYNHSSVARWLRGELPRDPAPDLIAEVLSVELGRQITAAEAGMRTREVSGDVGLEISTSQGGGVDVLNSLVEADRGGRRRILGSDVDPAACASAALRWLVGPWDTSPAAPAGGRRIGAAEVEEIRQVASAFRVLDNRLGGGQVRSPVADYLHSRVVPLLREARCSEEVRRGLFSAAADLTKLAAWIHHDLDRQGMAQRYLIQALGMARHAGDQGLGGEILAAMSQQAHYLALPDRAVDLARAGQVAAGRAGMPVLMTECQVMEAHGYAAQKQARACALALTRAETTYDQTGSGDASPEWLDYFDEAYYAARIAHCFRELENGAETQRYALKSLAMNPTYRRGKVFNVSILAQSLAVQGEVEEACVEGRRAVDLAGGISSQRVYRYIGEVHRALEPYCAEPVVAAFTQYAGERLHAP